MRVLEVAQKLGVTADTVRFYTRIELLQPKVNPQNRYKEFSQVDVERLKFIVGARQLGFTVDDIKTIISKAQKHQSACPSVRKIIEQRLEETERQFAELVQTRKRMKRAIKQWETMEDKMPTGTIICHMIENFDAGECDDSKQ